MPAARSGRRSRSPHPGSLTFVCHLPGHEAYGMTGMLVVTGG